MVNQFHCHDCGKFVNPMEAETNNYEGNIVYLCDECLISTRTAIRKMMEKMKEVQNA